MEWDGFRPVSYFLDMQKVAAFPLALIGEDGQPPEPITLIEALRNVLKDSKIVEVAHGFGETEVTRTGGEPLRFKGESFHRAVFAILLDLEKDGHNSPMLQWFWYDQDSVRSDPHESYSFFVVSGKTIVRERVNLFDTHRSGFDPSILTTGDDEESIWMRDEDWREARTRFWYRKFYNETETGQLMVLRPDEPPLHHYTEGRFNEGEYMGNIGTLLGKMYMLMWVLLAVGVLLLLR